MFLCQDFIWFGNISPQTFIKYIFCAKYFFRLQRRTNGQGHIFQYAYYVGEINKYTETLCYDEKRNGSESNSKDKVGILNMFYLFLQNCMHVYHPPPHRFFFSNPSWIFALYFLPTSHTLTGSTQCTKKIGIFDAVVW